jgi:hypothetical protein
MITYTGGCHCGRVRFAVQAPKVLEVWDCDCSICGMYGYLHLIVPARQFELSSGADGITTYTFNTGVAKHTFCARCGVKSFYTPRSHPDGISVNARCLDGVNIASLSVKRFNGRDWQLGRDDIHAALAWNPPPDKTG